MAQKKLIDGRSYGTGKRKTAVARVFLKSGPGVIRINGRSFEDYFPNESLRMVAAQPFAVIAKQGQFDADVNVHGGGVASQAQAVRHGISRALIVFDETFRPGLKRAGLLTRDSRVKERKKPGQPGARKKFQYSKR